MRKLLGVTLSGSTDAVRKQDLVAGNITGLAISANPSASLGLVAINGSASTWMRSDGAPALDVTIAPTWTGAHTFSNIVALSAGVTVTGHATINNASGVALSATGQVNLAASSTTGASYGVQITAGTNSSDFALLVWNVAQSKTFCEIYGDGHGFIGPSVTLGLSWNTTGNVTVNAPTSGVPLTVNGNSYLINMVTTTARGGGFCTLEMNDPSGLKAQIGFAAALDDLYFSNELSGNLILRTNGVARQTISAAGNVTISAPTSGVALAVTGVSTNLLATFTSGLSPTTSGTDLQVSRAGSTGNQISQGPNIVLVDSTNGTYSTWQHSGGQTELWQYNGSWNQILKVSTARGVSINAPASGIALGVTGIAGQYAAKIQAASSGTQQGLLIQGGAAASDFPLNILNQAGTANLMTVWGDGGVTIGAPTGGDKGPGTLNIQGTLYVNGVAVTVP